MNTQLHPIDFENWDRRQYFYYFTEMLPTGFNLNIEIDITKAHQKIKAAGKKFFPAYLYLTAKLITEQGGADVLLDRLSDQPQTFSIV
ncbi:MULTISPECIES: CatA-like O-acetyltransferase [unclassified Acetobacterium]|jgi:chloramphenicol O-acetyltransferase|uniref:CatA-like O-acetyltransferase n=1 Tax=unclassified Acetobacterium TaxID=2638182 RepID=UPI000DBEAC57|nr:MULTISPECIES: CatA-like O-acetyltransferase [unclassified Acetobacterium]AWW27519.1 hypothetical protein DOZ58_13280 [Acetobacterium sp. KB-1]MDZ5724038.1 CatA-like O-acetyltransferase [Acetobacterium sp. K1/6]